MVSRSYVQGTQGFEQSFEQGFEQSFEQGFEQGLPELIRAVIRACLRARLGAQMSASDEHAWIMVSPVRGVVCRVWILLGRRVLLRHAR